MSDIAIKVEQVGKLYRLGEVGTGTISHDLNRWWAKMRGKEDPFARIGELNDRTKAGISDYVWAVKDVSFDIAKGNTVGIIGRNGAGKSTLLKLLSKVTYPTQGKISISGRIASLLEVGTGFHPELTGRENIYQNGAILGMTKKEINSKFDEIADFSGVERYIDTPVKRYSSGMYVRLAFAVAAHLEPEILIVDEVLAVGDAEFQKKCLGKMKDVSVNDGRCVLFVSHNIAAIRQLCNDVIVLKNGTVAFNGNVTDGTTYYVNEGNINVEAVARFPHIEAEAYFTEMAVKDSAGQNVSDLNYDQPITLSIEVNITKDIEHGEISLRIKNSDDVNVIFTSLSDSPKFAKRFLRKGVHRFDITIDAHFLIPDLYFVSAYIHVINNNNIDYKEDALKFTIIETGSEMAIYGDNAKRFSCVFSKAKWLEQA